uniref:Uncharacterized protein n=1 Tax=mine drainage metagenome TaxID=410659 RepID=E6Q373_9ZZZZ
MTEYTYLHQSTAVNFLLNPRRKHVERVQRMSEQQVHPSAPSTRACCAAC